MTQRRGFSMIELLVALALTGILMGGLSMVFKSTISSFYQSGDILGAQRRARWAFAPLEDDLRMAGHMDGIAGEPTGLVYPPFRISPGGTGVTPLDTVEFFMNVPVEEARVLSAINAGDQQMVLEPIGKGNFLSKAGDYFYLRDGIHSEGGFLNGPPSNGVATLMDQGGINSLSASAFMGGRPLFQNNHLGGGVRTVMIMRPMQMVRYSIDNLKMDPDPAAPALPCLVRRQTDFSHFRPIQWNTVPYTMVSENVSSLQVDLSVDGGRTWTRPGAQSWDQMRGRANETLPAGSQVVDSEFWFKRVPLLLRVDLRARTAVQRQEYSPAGDALAFRERALVLMIAPRNCGLP